MENHLAALFVSPPHQGKGLGTELLNFIKTKYNHLSLNVYLQNKKAISFYKNHHFFVVEETVDDDTGELDLFMKWVRQDNKL